MIPQNLHMIWIGNAYKRPDNWIDTWRQKNPTWNFKLWTDEHLRTDHWHLKKHIDRLYRKRHFDGVSDLMRYEILWRHGGIYADADSICLRPLDDMIRIYDFWAVYESEKARPGKIQNAFMGAVRFHPILLNMIQEIISRKTVNKRWSWLKMKRERLPMFEATGPDFLTKHLKRIEGAGIGIHPSHLFFPCDVAGNNYSGPDKPYADHFYGTAHGGYEKIRWSKGETE